MRHCPDERVLRRHASGPVDSGTDTQVEAHLVECARCARRVAELCDHGGLLSEIRDAVQARDSAGPARIELDRLERSLRTTLFGGAA